MEKLVYLSFDLGFQSNYTKMYKWLDVHKALECGDSSCRFIYDFKSVQKNDNEEETKAMIAEIRKDITDHIDFLTTDRVYIASDFYWKGEISLNGLFVVGKRKPSNPWDGASGGDNNQIIIDE